MWVESEGYWSQVCLMDALHSPPLLSLQAREFQPITLHNSVTLPITNLLHLSRDVPISAHTMFKIYKVVYSNDHAFQWPAGRHTDELVIREWAKGGAHAHSPAPSCDPDTAAAANTCHTVVRPVVKWCALL